MSDKGMVICECGAILTTWWSPDGTKAIVQHKTPQQLNSKTFDAINERIHIEELNIWFEGFHVREETN